MVHANARLTPHGRWLLVERVRVQGRPVAHVARELGVSRQCAHRWVARFDAEGRAGLVDRSSRPRRSPRATAPELVVSVLLARSRLRRGPDELSRATGVPARTVSRILRRASVPYLWQCDPITGERIRASKTTAVRYEHARPGDLVHVDVKKIGRIPAGGGWRVHGRQRGDTGEHKRAKTGFDYVHAAVDDHSRVAYAEILDDGLDTLLACDAQGAIAAFAQLRVNHPPAGIVVRAPVELKRFYVDKAWHGQGLARSLMTAAEQAARARGAREFWLGVWERNERAQAFYRKCGFRKVGTQIFVVGTDPQTDNVMLREFE